LIYKLPTLIPSVDMQTSETWLSLPLIERELRVRKTLCKFVGLTKSKDPEKLEKKHVNL
jgi:hypothetical protein